MEAFKFTYNDREYELNENNCDYIANDEEKPVEGLELSDILGLIKESDEAHFDMEYYDMPCPDCKAGVEEKAKYFKFLEYHFFVYTKEGRYVISSISKDYENTSFNKLIKQKKADNSYIASVAVCVNCGRYSVEIEQCEV